MAGHERAGWRLNAAGRGLLSLLFGALAVAMPSSVSEGQGRTVEGRPSGDRSLQAVAARVLQILPSDVLHEDGGALEEPPRAPRLRETAWSELRAAVTALAGHLDPRRPGRDQSPAVPLAQQALRWAERAFDSLTRLDADSDAAFRELGRAFDRLDHAHGAASAAADAEMYGRVKVQFVQVGARMAADGIERARRAGLRDDRLAQAEAALRDGLALVDAGEYRAALDQFGDGVLVGNLPWFSMDRFEQNIRSAFNGEVIGYAYAIASQGTFARAGQNGVARTAADPPVTLQTALKEMNIASVSKPITATVLLQILHERGISVDSSIFPWLPLDWSKGPGIVELTFRDLLTHHSGLNQNQGGDYDFDSLRVYIAAGVVEADKETYQYQNGNFALFRLAIPYLLYNHPFIEGLVDLLSAFGATREQILAALYIDTVRTYAFEPTGFVQADCKPNDPAQTLLYRWPYDGSQGIQNGNWALRCGSGGWYMSAAELIGFMAHRRFNNQVMSPAARAAMDAGYLGWMDPDEFDFATGLYGIYRTHGGDLVYDDPLPIRGMRSCIMDYPHGIQATVLINSRGGNHAYQCAELANAYDNAFVIP